MKPKRRGGGGQAGASLKVRPSFQFSLSAVAVRENMSALTGRPKEEEFLNVRHHSRRGGGGSGAFFTLLHSSALGYVFTAVSPVLPVTLGGLTSAPHIPAFVAGRNS